MYKEKIIIITESTETGTDRTLVDLLIKHHKPFGDNAGVSFLFGKRPGGIGDVISRINDLSVAPEITSLKRPSALLIIVDADDNLKSRYKEIVKNIDNKILSVGNTISKFGTDKNKIKTGVFLFPNSKDTGSLETLCYGAINLDNSEKKKQCIENYFDCLKSNFIDQQITKNNASKARFRIYNATPKPDYNYVKNAIRNLDLDSDVFAPLIKFLKSATN